MLNNTRSAIKKKHVNNNKKNKPSAPKLNTIDDSTMLKNIIDTIGPDIDDEFDATIPPEMGPEMIEENSFRIISSVISDLGLTRTNDMFLIDMHDVFKYTVQLGLESFVRDANVNDNFLSVLIHNFYHSIYEDINGVPRIHNFTYDDSRDKWVKNKKEANNIEIVGHHEDDYLFCPECNTEYKNNNDVIFAQTVSMTNMTVRLTHESSDDINITRPHVVLTPVCPQCYMKSLGENDLEIPKNISPFFMGQGDEDKRLIPLLPICFKNSIKESKENTHTITNIPLFWPKTQGVSICTTGMDVVDDKNNKG
jgi:hypothetical protein